MFIGTAGWTNPPCERAERAASHSHLEHYATRFNAVEINSSFYRSHKPETYQRWRDSTPSAFCFSVKAPRAISHECALRHCHSEVKTFLREISGLAEKLRVVLVQTPASVEFDPRSAKQFFARFASAGTFRIAFEPRHRSWFTDKAETMLRRAGVTRVAADPARTLGGDESGGDPSLKYYRLHGSPRIYYSSYSDEFLSRLACEVKSTVEAKDVWCIFDNTARQASWGNAKTLGEIRARCCPS